MTSSYNEAIDYLFGLQRFGIKLGLANTNRLLGCLGNPHRSLRCIHIAGSNGKGSTGALLHSILTHSGYQPGFYTSPHLVDFTERIKIGDRTISRSAVVQLTNTLKRICKKRDMPYITFFEVVTAMAFAYFREHTADPVIVEVGLGGRFDATNVIRPLVSIITSVHLEHQMYLGRTYLEIAREKAGIIKRRVPVVSGVEKPEVRSYLRRVCSRMDAPLYQVGDEVVCRPSHGGTFLFKGLQHEYKNLTCGLIGTHQMRNASMAVAAALVLKKRGYSIPPDAISEGIRQVTWPGRLEIIRRNPTVVLDGAHNPAAWRALRKTLDTTYRNRRLFLLLGVMEDKDIASLIRILTPRASSVVFTCPQMDRSARKARLAECVDFSKTNKFLWTPDVRHAYRQVMQMATAQDLVCVTGSLFLVGEVREHVLQHGRTASGRIGM